MKKIAIRDNQAVLILSFDDLCYLHRVYIEDYTMRGAKWRKLRHKITTVLIAEADKRGKILVTEKPDADKNSA